MYKQVFLWRSTIVPVHFKEGNMIFMGAWKRMNYKHFINLTTYKLKSLKHYCRQEWPIGVSPSTANYALLADATCSETTGLTHSSWPRQQIKARVTTEGGLSQLYKDRQPGQ